MKKLLISIVLVSLGFTLGYYVGRRSLGPAWGEARRPVPQQPASQAETKLGPWKARFNIPGSVQMPDNSPIIGFDVPQQSAEFEFFGYMNVTITNLSTSRYGIRYNIYGYDSKGRRVSEGEDQFAIGSHESVVREVLLHSHAAQTGVRKEFGRTFWVQMVLEE